MHDLPLHCRRYGDPAAEPLVFLHGITGSTNYWNRAIPHFQRDFHVVLTDLPGFGESPKPDIDYTMEVFSGALRNHLIRLGLAERPLTVIGHSLGALVALEYAARHPGHLRRLVLLSLPRHDNRQDAHRIFLEHSVNYRRILGVNSLGACVRSAVQVGPSVFFSYLARFPSDVVRDSRKFTLRSLLTTLENCLLAYRLDDLLPRVPEIPALLLHGERDMVAPARSVEPLPAAYPGFRLVVVRRTGHHLFLTHPQLCMREMDAFLGETARVPGIPLRLQGAPAE